MNIQAIEIALAFLFLIGMILYFLWIIIPNLSGLPWIPTQPKRIRSALKLAGLSPGEVFYDLGSGDGRAIILAAREYGARAIGIEISPIHCLVAAIKARLEGVHGQVKIRWASFYRTNINDAQVVFAYMTAKEMSNLRQRLEKQLRPGTRVVTVSCQIDGWQPVAFDSENLLYLYRVGTSSADGPN